jgi:hypothetical protein
MPPRPVRTVTPGMLEVRGRGQTDLGLGAVSGGDEPSVEGHGSRAGDGGAKVRQRKAGERGEWRVGWRVTPWADPGKGAV